MRETDTRSTLKVAMRKFLMKKLDEFREAKKYSELSLKQKIRK